MQRLASAGGRNAFARRAFTLVELIVTLTLVVLVTGSTLGLIRTMTATRERVDRQLDLQHEARAAMRVIVSALRNAHRPTEQEWLIEGVDEWEGGHPADRLRLMTVGRTVVRPGQPESDVRECEFSLMASDEGKLPMLMRRVDPTRNEQPDGGGVLERIAGSVVALDFVYHDGLEWVEEWPETDELWPSAIRVRLTVATEKPPVATWTLSRTINFPYRPTTKKKGTDTEGTS